MPRVTFTDPQAGAVGATGDRFSATVRRSDSGGYLTLLSDGERLTGVHALGPGAGEWLQQAAPAIHARVDTIQPLPTFSETYLAALKALPDELAQRGERRHSVMERPPGRHRRRRLGGLQAVLGLRNANVEITLIDRRNFHLFQPLSYQVATGALSPGEVAYPLRAVFKRDRTCACCSPRSGASTSSGGGGPPVGRRSAHAGAGAL